MNRTTRDQVDKRCQECDEGNVEHVGISFKGLPTMSPLNSPQYYGLNLAHKRYHSISHESTN